MRERFLAAIAGITAAVGLIAPALADDLKQMVLIPADTAVQWAPGPASLPRGTQLSVLAGDPSKPGPFVLRVKFPANTVVAPHTHATAENLTVISGVIFNGMGEKLEQSQGKQLSGGGFVYLPGEMPHSVWTTTEPSEIQVTGTGPFGLHYVNPADDPSKLQ
jgi:quercetin dioxygenase-like cupin family protein